MTAYRFKPRISVAERTDLARSLAMRDGVPRVFGIASFLKTWQSGLLREGVAPFPLPSLPPRLSARTCRDKLAYFLTYYAGSLALSPYLGELSIAVSAEAENRLTVSLSAPYLKKELPLLFDTASLLRLSPEGQKLLANATRELGVSVVVDRTRTELKVHLSIGVFTAEPTLVREESALERAAILAAVAAAFADLRRL